MQRLHVVQPGEWLGSIARNYGLAGAQDLYDFEANSHLRETRDDPNLVHPGDEVWVPATANAVALHLNGDGVSRLSVTARAAAAETIEVVLRDDDGDPVAATPYEFQIGGYHARGTTDDQGRVIQEFDARYLSYGRYTLVVDGQSIDLAVGHLDPINTVRGVQGRLANLGFDPGAIDGRLGPRTRSAVCRFQSAHDLTVDGSLSNTLRDRLLSEHP